jgi:hypothetical protein
MGGRVGPGMWQPKILLLYTESIFAYKHSNITKSQRVYNILLYFTLNKNSYSPIKALKTDLGRVAEADMVESGLFWPETGLDPGFQKGSCKGFFGIREKCKNSNNQCIFNFLYHEKSRNLYSGHISSAKASYKRST